jgi:hypothetical protein
VTIVKPLHEHIQLPKRWQSGTAKQYLSESHETSDAGIVLRRDRSAPTPGHWFKVAVSGSNIDVQPKPADPVVLRQLQTRYHALSKPSPN